jgi:hypothetical protein
MQYLNKAVDSVRREGQKTHIELKKSKYLWLRNNEDLSTEKQVKLEEQANYHFLMTKNTIELIRRNHDGSTTTLIGTNGLLRNTVSYTSELYNSFQLVEITTLNQANGVKIGLKIGGVTLVDVVDYVAGYLTNAGFLMFNAGRWTGTTYISDPEMILGVDEKKRNSRNVIPKSK